MPIPRAVKAALYTGLGGACIYAAAILTLQSKIIYFRRRFKDYGELVPSRHFCFFLLRSFKPFKHTLLGTALGPYYARLLDAEPKCKTLSFKTKLEDLLIYSLKPWSYLFSYIAFKRQGVQKAYLVVPKPWLSGHIDMWCCFGVSSLTH